MSSQMIFKRYEIKYILSLSQAENLKSLMKEYMKGDKYGNSTICNIYFDTPDFILVRRSLEKPIYKEKLRLRSYGICNGETKVFPELKKKYESIVYKRRLEMSEVEAMKCLSGKTPFPNTQVGREIAYCFKRYPSLQPKVFLSYEREAFYAKDNDNFRMTFDKNILWRDYDLSLCKGVYGNYVLPSDNVILEVKTADSLPIWLVEFLSKNNIYKTSFSKYGSAYMDLTNKKSHGGISYA